MTTPHMLSKAVIPVGGLGTRLLPATKVLPKEMLPVGRRPMVQYVVEEMRAAGLEHICFVTGRKKALIQEHFDHDPELVRHLQDMARDEMLAELAYLESGLHLTYIRQSGPQGLADALSLAAEFVGDEPFVVALGDTIVCEPVIGTLLRTMVREHLSRGAVATVAVETSHFKSRNHTVIVPAQGTSENAVVFDVVDVAARSRSESVNGGLAPAGRFVFDPAVFAAMNRTPPARSGETQLVDSLRLLLRDGAKVQAVRLGADQRRHDIGNFAGYFRAFLEFAVTDPDCGEEILEYLHELNGRRLAGDSDGSD